MGVSQSKSLFCAYIFTCRQFLKHFSLVISSILDILVIFENRISQGFQNWYSFKDLDRNSWKKLGSKSQKEKFASPPFNNDIIMMIKLVMLTLYVVLYSRGKLIEEDKPSGLTSSVERGEELPPSNKVGPPSPSTSQHKCQALASTRLTEVGLKAPVRGFSFRQDCRVDDVRPPPHSICPQSVCHLLTSPGRSARLQECLVWGLNTSTLTLYASLGVPPVIITPGTKYIHKREGVKVEKKCVY